MARNNEIQLSALHFGGDFYLNGARARIMTQFGTRSTVIPRNDLSQYRLPNPNNPSQPMGPFPFSANPRDQFEGSDCSTNFDFMPTQNMTFRFEYVHRKASVSYFAGHGGVTSQTGMTTTTLDPDWRPDLVKSEDRIILVMLFRM